ncbi:TPA: hypothetical protein N0F65_010794 [Lagenidium giganteum]|uniref:CKK domain-containing protein n=1 Tax=Lagenidium giganteum TaxID=4803 RepID=A0AAV2YJ82_9STRA|nr:TPA: hypothetical protein N0F65_010794 [Lagenidium giganteum]
MTQVLASTASPSQLCCSKDLLAPLVLEAHRLGQHAAKTESHGATAPRKLFQLLRAKDGAGISTELRGMEFGDMTWEFAGPVSQTLEIELQDLEERLQASFGENEQQSAAIMVISTSGTEACVIWEAKAHIKRLVYVCPGRVKVVKSTTELLKKILEEMPTLNAPGAGFALWTLFAKRPKSPAEPLLQASALEVQRKHRKSEETRVVITDVRRSPTPSIFAFGHVVKIEPAGPDEQDVRCNVDNQEVGIPSPSPGDAIPLTNAIESVQSVPHPAEALADESVLGDPVPASRYRSQAQLAHVSASLSGWKAAQDTADVTSEKRDDSDDDDEKSALEAWGNTRFQKQPSADSDGLILSHEKLTIPFNHLGRVPMRPERRKHSLQKDPDDCSSAIKPDFRDQATSLAQPSKNPNELGSSPHSTFVMIDLHEPAQHSSKKTRSPTRQEKLHNLRQKKIQQLQQRRNKELAAATEPTATSGGVYPSVTKPKADLHPTSTMIAPLAKARRPSNRKLIQNAIEYTVLAGVSVEKERAAALQALAESTCDNFILLLKSSREMKFRGLYEFHADSDRVVRVYSLSVKCPQELTPDSISQFFRYNSGKKEFLPVDTRSFTVKTDACALLDQLVFKNTARSQLRHLL